MLSLPLLVLYAMIKTNVNLTWKYDSHYKFIEKKKDNIQHTNKGSLTTESEMNCKITKKKQGSFGSTDGSAFGC